MVGHGERRTFVRNEVWSILLRRRAQLIRAAPALAKGAYNPKTNVMYFRLFQSVH